jgi:large subunit ribosomal protein L46
MQQEQQCYGAKVFYYVANYMDGEIELNSEELVDYAWVTREEVAEYIDPALYKYVNQILW